MEGPKENTPPSRRRPLAPAVRRDGPLLVVLLVVAAGIHLWLIRHTEVPAGEGVGFIRYAWQWQSQPWVEALRETPPPPLYPLAVLAVSVPVRPFVAANDTVAMQLSAQLTSAL